MICSNPTCNRKFQKRSKKIQKIRNAITASFQVKLDGKYREREKIKKNHSDGFLPDSEKKIPKK